jgi:dienelactone hydrolase
MQHRDPLMNGAMAGVTPDVEQKRPRMSSAFPLVCTLVIAGGLLLAGMGRPASAQSVELLPLETVTFTTQQFLAGAVDGKPVTIAGALRIPKATSGRIPAVIFMEGAGGITPMIEKWVEVINGIGIATFVPDSFSGRGISDASKLDNIAQMIDAYRALEVLAAHPRIDPKRIAVMGLSRGALAALYSSMVRFQTHYAPPGIAFAAHIALYAPCNTSYRDDDKLTGNPIRLFHGSADDLFPAEPCREYVARLKQAGVDIAMTEYPNATHAYDAFVITGTQRVPQARSTRNCHLTEGDNGQILNSATGQPFAFSDQCVERGLTFAYDEAATTATVAAVKDFLTNTLK